MGNNNTEINRIEIEEWLASLDYVIKTGDQERVKNLLRALQNYAAEFGIQLPYSANTPYLNTIPRHKQIPYPGNLEIEKRIRSLIRWNALTMVIKANIKEEGIGGHISTYASCATLLETGFNHFFRGKEHTNGGDFIYFQGHAAPGIYARAFLEGRLTEQQLINFRRELTSDVGGGLSSYPHPYCMPNFWEFPTVSMGLGPIMAIYQARFNRYLEDRGLISKSDAKVWAFIGDGESDEPETLGAISLAAREKLDNLIFVVNCNLQRLDGPVRGNYKIIQELEAVYRGSGWNVIKIIWGGLWDGLLSKDVNGLLIERMEEALDGDYQTYSASNGSYIREHFFGKSKSLAEMVEHFSDDDIKKLNRGGHDPEKVYSAFKAATEYKNGPSVILAKTIKGYGLGEAGEGKNITHQHKKLNEEDLRRFRARFSIPISDGDLKNIPFYKPDAFSEEMIYLNKKRNELGGSVPKRNTKAAPLIIPDTSAYEEFYLGSDNHKLSTTMVFIRLLTKLLKDKNLGKHIVPIIPDEGRTFGMEALFKNVGIYSHVGQLYQPVDRDSLLYYKEAVDGQIIEEGITEAGGFSSFIAAGTSYSTHSLNMIPFFIFYSMFGFQRVGDLAWAAGDMGCRGFLMGGTAGRTTLAGEGLQHQDGHSHLLAFSFPHIKAYDPAFAFEIAVIVEEGLKQMYQYQKNVIFYITISNEPYEMPPVPPLAEAQVAKTLNPNLNESQVIQSPFSNLNEVQAVKSPTLNLKETQDLQAPFQIISEDLKKQILAGLYLFKNFKSTNAIAKIKLLASGALMNESLKAAKILSEEFLINIEVWSVTSYKSLYQDLIECERINSLNGNKEKIPYIYEMLSEKNSEKKSNNKTFVLSVSDYTRCLALSISKAVPFPFIVLGTDGFGKSESRKDLRNYFEVDKEHICIYGLSLLLQNNIIEKNIFEKAVEKFQIDLNKLSPINMSWG